MRLFSYCVPATLLFALLCLTLLVSGCSGGGGTYLSKLTADSFLRTQPGGSSSFPIPLNFSQKIKNATAPDDKETMVRDESVSWNNCFGGMFEDEAYSLCKTDASEIYIDSSSLEELTPDAIEEQSPVLEYFITDPLNRKTGYIFPSSKARDAENVVVEIPDSQYLYGGVTRLFRLIGPMSGTYTMQVIGTREGAYQMYFTIVGAGTPVKHQRYRGISRITAPGAIHNYQIVYDRDDVSKSQLIMSVSPQEIKDSLQIAIKYGWIDNQGILNSLTKKIDHAESAVASGKIDTAVNVLNAFINEVQAQSGKHIKKEAANILISDAQAYIKQLQQ